MDFVMVCWTYCRAGIAGRIKSERGASLVEYALLLALISVICVGAITILGGNTSNKLSSAGSSLQ